MKTEDGTILQVSYRLFSNHLFTEIMYTVYEKINSCWIFFAREPSSEVGD
jgi:hypothetical protein